MFEVTYSTKAFKFLKKADTDIRHNLSKKIQLLKVDPFSQELDIKKLKGRDGYRLRVGDYRVIYTIDNNIITIFIIDIAHRKEIYQ